MAAQSFDYMDFANKYIVEIPLIQRDYVQGANTNSQKRDDFLEAVFAALESDSAEPLNLDFIYGTVKEDRMQPIDGQQRMTSLFLLAWLLMQKSAKSYPLPRLEYRTRNATEQFVSTLATFKMPEQYEKSHGTISAYISEIPAWFAEDWKKDPSIQTMLQMLDAMEARLPEVREEREKLAQRFFEGKKFRFECLPLNEFSLGEDLYIKMNARGKPLTDFEIWKANFAKMLQEKFGGASYNDLPVQEYFSLGIEQRWSALFWPAAFNKWKNLTEAERKKAVYPRLDEFFMNFFNNFSQLLLYVQNPAESQTADSDEARIGRRRQVAAGKLLGLYKEFANVELLFKLLDRLVELEGPGGGIGSFFANIFSAGVDAAAPDKINLFTTNTDLNLFHELITKGTLRADFLVLFYGICKRLLKFGADNADNQFTDFVRVYWGWLLYINQRRADQMNVETDFRMTYMQAADKLLEEFLKTPDIFQSLAGISDLDLGYGPLNEAIKQEKLKVAYRAAGKYEAVKKLMQYPELHGDFRHIYPALDALSGNAFVNRFKEFVNLPESSQILHLISYGYRGIRSYNEYCIFLGKKDNWAYIFTSDEEDFTKAFTSWILKDKPVSLDKDSFIYYLNKYFIGDFSSTEYNKNYYFWDGSTYGAWVMKRYIRNRLGYNACPFAHAVYLRLSDKQREKFDAASYSLNSDKGALYLGKYGFWMQCVENGWEIGYYDLTKKERKQKGMASEDDLENIIFRLNTFKFKDKVLQDRKNEDRIETALAYMNALDKALP